MILCCVEQELMAATLLLENMLRGERFKPHWRICNMPAPSPSHTGSPTNRVPCPAFLVKLQVESFPLALVCPTTLRLLLMIMQTMLGSELTKLSP